MTGSTSLKADAALTIAWLTSRLVSLKLKGKMKLSFSVLGLMFTVPQINRNTENIYSIVQK